MPFGLTPGLAVALALALLLAAFVRGYSGFGFSAVVLAFAALVTDPRPLIPVLFTCEILLSALQARSIRGHVDWRRTFLLWAGAAVAIPLSVFALVRMPADVARLAVSAIVGVLSLVLLGGWQIRRRLGATGHVAVGAVSGLANGAGVGGLPVAAMLAAQPVSAAQFRGTLVAYITGMDLMTLPVMGAAGLMSGQTLAGVALALPLLALGMMAGNRRFALAAPQEFRRLVILLLLALSLIGVARALLA